MPRNMSFALTTEQIKNKTKTVTRRYAWGTIKVGDIVNAVEKAMGIPKGEKINRFCQIRIVSVTMGTLWDVDKEECIKEGFPDMTPEQFRNMLLDAYDGATDMNTPIRRIEFEYV